MSCDFLTTKGILRKLGGDKVSGKVYTFNGDTSGKFAANNIVNISEDVPDLKNVTKIVLANSNGATAELLLSNLVYMEQEGMVGILDPNDQSRMYVVSLYSCADGGPAGLYVRCADDGYVSRIEFAETIHPIDPKYLGGVCLPVVELTLEQVSNIVQAGAAGWIVASGYLFDALEAAYNAGLPLIVGLPGESGILPAIASAAEYDGLFTYEFKFSDATILMNRLTLEEISAWKIAVSGV